MKAKKVKFMPEPMFRSLQKAINDGTAWRLEVSIGRAAMEAIRDGYCVLGEEGHTDSYGNYVPSRYEIEDGTKGSISYALKIREEMQ